MKIKQQNDRGLEPGILGMWGSVVAIFPNHRLYDTENMNTDFFSSTSMC